MSKPLRIAFGPLVLLAAVARFNPVAAQASATANSITLLASNQPPCSVPTSHSVLRFKLAYRLAEAEQSAYGFMVSVKFQGTEPGHTFSNGRYGQVSVSARQDTLTLTYPMSAVLNPPNQFTPRLRRPITCYLYLHRNTGPGRSTVLAQTPAIVFQNCQ